MIRTTTVTTPWRATASSPTTMRTGKNTASALTTVTACFYRSARSRSASQPLARSPNARRLKSSSRNTALLRMRCRTYGIWTPTSSHSSPSRVLSRPTTSQPARPSPARRSPTVSTSCATQKHPSNTTAECRQSRLSASTKAHSPQNLPLRRRASPTSPYAPTSASPSNGQAATLPPMPALPY